MNQSNQTDKEILSAQYLLNEDKYAEAEASVNLLLKTTNLNSLTQFQLEQIANIYLQTGNFNTAREIYLKNNDFSGAAFSLIFLQELDKAKEYLKNSDESPLSNWCGFLIEIFEKRLIIKTWPSFLGTRHFLQTTAFLLLKLKNKNYFLLLIKNLKNLLDINLDSEKYISLAYWNYGDKDQAILRINNSIKRNPSDPEAYMILGKICLEKNMLHEALEAFENTILLIPEHKPALKSIEEIKLRLKNH